MDSPHLKSRMGAKLAIVGAASSIGIRPYDDGTVRRLDLAPAALREQGLVARLGGRDLGDVVPPPYRDFVRPPNRPRNETELVTYSHALSVRVRKAALGNSFVLLLGGDCSIVLGALLSARKATGRVGLIYVDAHGDFATPELSRTGSVASMCLAMAVGRGDSTLARLGGDEPLVRPDDLVVVGRRDDGDAPWYGQELLRTGPMLDLTCQWIREHGVDATARAALARMEHPAITGFWIHVDADVLDPAVIPAVDSPEPGGLGLDEIAALLTPLVQHQRALGLQLTIYDPKLDPDRTSAARLADLLVTVLSDGRTSRS